MRLFLQNISLILLISLAVPVAGSRSRALNSETIKQQLPRSPELQAIMSDANQRFQSGDYSGAEQLYSRGLSISRAQGDEFNAACFLAGKGNYLVLTHEYDDAAEAFREATHAALQANHRDLALRVAVNRATLYRRMGEKAAALQAMRVVRDIIPAQPPSWLLIQAGNLAADEIGIAKASPYFLAAAERAAADGDYSMQASAMAQLGYLQLQSGHLAQADDALTEAFRLRKMSGNRQTGSLYLYLSMLRLAQGDHSSALHLVDRALDYRGNTTAVAPPFLRHQRARVLAASGRLAEAREEFGKAISSGQDWRMRVVRTDAFRIGADVTLQEVYAASINLEMALFRKTGRQEFERRAFELAETNRAASLRETSQQRAFPASYWTTVENLRKALAAEARGEAEFAASAEEFRRQLIEHELESDCPGCNFSHQIKERSSSGNSLSRLQQRLSKDEALLSFHTSERESYVWAMTRESFESHVLESRKEIAAAATAFRQSIGGGSGAIAARGAGLRKQLFGKLSSRITSKHSWILSVDEPLHEVPFAALPSFDPSSRFLAETHSIRIVPGAAMMRPAGDQRDSDRFVAFADAIYNTADPRWTGTADGVSPELPRLPGTHNEALTSAVSWNGPKSIVTGALTRSSVREALSQTAAIAHFGGHVVPDHATRGGVTMSLGLNASGTAEYLTPTDIARWRCPVGVVVLSGCHSGTGQALPGAGMVGLTRAWLVAGARAVTATHWPITDDAEVFFSIFYRHLRRNSRGAISASAAAASLRAAQVELLRGEGSQSNPEYWAAFFVVGKD
jgi:CHAT domain-containing protein